MRRLWVFLVAGAVVLAACGGGGGSDAGGDPSTSGSAGASSPATAAPMTAPGRENIAFYYQQIHSGDDLSKLGKVSLVVAGKTAARSAVVAIKKIGAKAYRGVQAYWFADGGTYDGLEVTKRSDWAYCQQGSTPYVARTDPNGAKWYFLDSNERGVHTEFAEKLKALRLQGWDGVFFDRGLAGLSGRDDISTTVWHQASTCTQDPIDPNATLSDAYLGMAKEVKKAGLELLMNYGFSPFDANTPMRPDPRDPKCVDKQPGCKILDDVWPAVDGVLDEAVAHPKDELWANDFRSNRLNEKMAKQGKYVVGLLTEGTMGGVSTRASAYYEWARVKLFVIPLGINTGDDNCGNPPAGTLCNRRGLFPELAGIVYGAPVDAAPEPLNCTAGSDVHCVWVRKYQLGMSVVNVSPTPKSTGFIPLGVDGCRYVKDVETGQPLADNQCVKGVSFDLFEYTGHPLVYSQSPW